MQTEFTENWRSRTPEQLRYINVEALVSALITRWEASASSILIIRDRFPRLRRSELLMTLLRSNLEMRCAGLVTIGVWMFGKPTGMSFSISTTLVRL
jgi:hypothetical protein